MNPISTTHIMHQFQDAEEKISRERGEFTFFGLFERTDIFGKYDVVVAAPWLKDDLPSLDLITELVTVAIGNIRWWSKIGYFAIVPANGPFLEVVREALLDGPIRHGSKRITNIYYEGNMIPSATIITSVEAATESAAQAGKRSKAVAV